MITMEMEDIEIKPVSRRGLMILDVYAHMSESQMHDAVEAFKEYITGETWCRWLEEWNKEAKEEKEERQYEFEQRINAENRRMEREGHALADTEM